MNESRGQMNLNVFLTSRGYHSGSWRRAGSRSEELAGFKFLAEMAALAEQAKIDGLFIADTTNTATESFGKNPTVTLLEPITKLAALASVTDRIGLIGTASTSFNEPFNVARQFGSLDHISDGRAGWNIVTSWAGEDNFGTKLLDHAGRYRRASEFTEVVTQLWDSWQDDAVINDREGGCWARPERIHEVNYSGEFFNVRGPLTDPRPPQGWPVLVQAGTSASGMSFAARWAEVIFTVQPNIESAIEFYDALKKMVVNNGRDPRRVKILPGLMPILGRTLSEARELERELSELIDFDTASQVLRRNFGMVEIDDLDWDDRIPVERLTSPEAAEGNRSRHAILYRLAVDEKYTLRQLCQFLSTSGGHMKIVGTPESIADVMESWFTTGACDGFNLEPPFMPGGLESIVHDLVPVLQDRGLFRKEYTGSTLREHLGLERPTVG
ncbi:LLM class flavin-dependent oxidoreductase [Rhodococcus rhodochrous]|uniref:LLM class flavin-dependent oxidoreductase n=1 Tax=Rhodococcus rhodochrous TaxID=1829 RepID=UPI0002F89166|nr:LLM class flavin-dependent oxidoreductase [Rhodococcus rhodochrous]